MDKTWILNELKKYYKLSSNAEFSRFLGISPQTLSNWYGRNTLDYELIYTKCVDVSGDWLLTGQGEMLRQLGQVTAPAAKAVEPPPQQDGAIAIYRELLAEKDKQIQELNREVGRLEGEVRALREVLVQRAGGGAPNAGEQGADRAAS